MFYLFIDLSVVWMMLFVLVKLFFVVLINFCVFKGLYFKDCKVVLVFVMVELFVNWICLMVELFGVVFEDIVLKWLCSLIMRCLVVFLFILGILISVLIFLCLIVWISILILSVDKIFKVILGLILLIFNRVWKMIFFCWCRKL